MLTTLLAKTTGGFRPIGLYWAMFRIWSRARRSVVTEWLHRTMGNSPVYTTMPRRRAADAVWRAQVCARSAPHKSVIEANWDSKKCFENVDRALLARVGARHGYPPAILRLSLASNSWDAA